MLNPNAIAAISQVQKRILPAQLHQPAPKNEELILGWVVGSGLLSKNESVTVYENFLYTKINEHYQELVWNVPPAKLKTERLRKANIANAEKPLDRIALG